MLVYEGLYVSMTEYSRVKCEEIARFYFNSMQFEDHVLSLK